MDPKDNRVGSPRVVQRYVPDGWDESSGVKPTVKTQPTPGYRLVMAHIVTLADGREELWVLNGQGKEAEKIADLEANKDVADRWKSSQPTATSQATAGRQQQSRVMATNPETGKPAWKITNFDGSVEYDENVPATVTGGVAANAKGRKGTVEGNEWVEREIEADGSQGRIVEQRPATQTEKDSAAGRDRAAETKAEAKTEADRKEQEAKAGKWTETSRQATKNQQTGQAETTITEQNELGETRTRSASETTIQKPEPGKLVTYNGEQFEQTTGPNGEIVLRKPQVQGQDMGAPPPSAKSKIGRGQVEEFLNTIANEIDEQMRTEGKDAEWARKKMEPFYQRATIALKEQGDTATTALNTRTQDINQRQQDVSMANQRMASGGSLFGGIVGDIAPLLRNFPKGSTGGGDLLLSLLKGSRGYLGQLGALANPQQIGRGNILESYMQGAPLQGGAGQPPVTINIGGPGGGMGGGSPLNQISAATPMAQHGGDLKSLLDWGYSMAQADPNYTGEGVDVPEVNPQVVDMVRDDVSGNSWNAA